MEIILALIAVLVPAVAAYLAMQVSKKFIPFLDALPGVVKQIVAIVYAFLAMKLSTLFGVPFPAELAALGDPAIVGTILTGVASWVLHKIFKPA